MKKYFIKDEELSSINEDKLSSKDISNNISEIIDNTKPPFAISVTGKSGIGKSSIINLVAEKYEKNTDEYNVEKINLWKEEESLKSILDCNNDNQNTISAEIEKQERQNLIDSYYNQNFEEESTPVEENKNKKSFIRKTGKFILTVFICFIITTLIYILMEYIANKDVYRNDLFFVENTYLSYRENFAFILIFTAGLTAIAYIINTLLVATKNASKMQNNTKVVNQDVDVEKETVNVTEPNVQVSIENNTNKAKRIINPNKTNIIIVEDVDKLPAAKMLKAIEDVKYCTDYENCIFIVPFDEKVLAKAIDVRNQVKLSANYRPLKFERILEKVFQFNVNVPHIATGNMKEYAINLAKETVIDFAEEYCELPVFQKVIRNVLIHKGVTTPRHVKRLINNFINNRILIANRINSKKIDSFILEDKKFDYELAKITVLQSDFKEFYNVLFKDFNYLEELTNLYCMDINELKIALENLDEELKPFMTEKNRALMNFLVQTKNCQIENMSTLMYATRVKTEEMFKGKPLLSYIIGDEDISELRIQEVVDLVKTIDNKEDLKEFTENNFTKLLEKYKENASNKVYFNGISEIVDLTGDYIDEPTYLEYLEVVAENYNYYPEEALKVFTNTKIEIPTNIMNVLIVKINETISKENYDETFEFLMDNCDSLYEEDGNISEYVHFLVNNIALASKPTEVIEELDSNFTRIGKINELYANIQNLENLDYDKAYAFISKCLDNSDLDRLVNVMNNILSEENSVEKALKIEANLNNYTLVDVVECNVDDIIAYEEEENNDTDTTEESEKAQANKESQEDIEASIENAKLLEGNYVLLKNIIEICAEKQTYIASVDTMKILEKTIQNIDNSEYILSIFELLKKFDRMYFYEKRREFNEIIYAAFHNSKNEDVKKEAVEITKFFKNTRLFKTKLTADEEKYYEEN